MPGKELTAWLDEYALSHQHPTNILIHKICVPTITVTLFAMLWSLPFIPRKYRQTIILNPAIILVPILAFYWRLSPTMAVTMGSLFVLIIAGLFLLEKKNVRIFRLALIVFVLAWIGQFVGHELEGKKPAFFKDLQFLFIGPLWTLAHFSHMDEFLTHLHYLNQLFDKVEIQTSLDDIELIGRQLKYSQEYLVTEIHRLKNEFDNQTNRIQQANELRKIDQKTLLNFQRKFQDLTEIFSNLKKKEINTWHLVQILRVNTSRLWHIFESATGSTITQEMLYEDLQKSFEQSQFDQSQYQSNSILLEKEHGQLLLKVKDIQINLEQFRSSILQLTQTSTTLKARIQTQHELNNQCHEQTTKKTHQLNFNRKLIDDLLVDYQYLITKIHSIEKFIFHIQTEIQIHQKSILIYQTKYEKYKQDLLLLNLNRTKHEYEIENLTKFLFKQKQIFKQFENEEKQIQAYRQRFHQQIEHLEMKKLDTINRQQQLLDQIKQRSKENKSTEQHLFQSNRIHQNLLNSHRKLFQQQTKQHDRTDRLSQLIENNQQQLNVVKNELNQFIDEVEQQNQQIDANEKQIDFETKQFAKLQHCVSQTDNELTSQRSKIHENQTKLKLFQQQIYKLTADDKPVSKEISHHQQQIRQYRINQQQLNIRLKQNEDNIQLYQTMIGKLIIESKQNEFILTKEQFQINQYQKQTIKHQTNKQILNKNLTITEDNYRILKNSFLEMNYENQKLNKQFTDLTYIIQLLGERQVAFNYRLKPLYNKIQHLNQQHLDHSQSISQLKIDLLILKKYSSYLQNSNTNLRNRLSLSSQLDYEYLHTQFQSIHHSHLSNRLRIPMNSMHDFQKLSIHSPDKCSHLSKLFAIKKQLVRKTNQLVHLKKIFHEKKLLYRYLNRIFKRRERLFIN